MYPHFKQCSSRILGAFRSFILKHAALNVDPSLHHALQKLSFKPNCTWRGPPDPDTGLVASGVTVATPKLVFPAVGLVPAGDVPPPLPDAAKSALLNKLKNSMRNCALYLSFSFHIFATEKSTL